MPSQPSFTVSARIEAWPLANPFVISRGQKTKAHVVVAELQDKDGLVGRGECVPYARYGQSLDAVVKQIEVLPAQLSHDQLNGLLPISAAQNAVDCALWDYEAKRFGRPVSDLIGIAAAPEAVDTAFTLSLAAPDAMAQAASEAQAHAFLKLKLGASDGLDGERILAVRNARPTARLVGDANEGWTPETVFDLLATAAQCKFELIEQPLPAGNDQALMSAPRPVMVCADESHHTASDIPELKDRYDAINVKLDKAGGLTGALNAVEVARAHDLQIMIGSMVATSLAIAPAYLLAGQARWVDLDGPLLLANDRDDGFTLSDGRLQPGTVSLWGAP